MWRQEFQFSILKFYFLKFRLQTSKGLSKNVFFYTLSSAVLNLLWVAFARVMCHVTKYAIQRQILISDVLFGKCSLKFKEPKSKFSTQKHIFKALGIV